MPLPLIIIADQTLAIQAHLGDLLVTDAAVVSAVKPKQLEYWWETSSQKPDLLILERSFFDIDYSEFCQNWRQHPNTRDSDILILGERNDEYEVEALLAGAADYLVKPLNPVLILARVKAQLKRRHEIARLEALSSTDGLTGVANRRYLDHFLAAEWGRAQRENGNLGAIMIDIDHFKLFNDYYGHVAGDECLRQVAGIIAECAQRPRDLVARYGGEEFVVILPSVQVEGLEVVAQRLQRAIAHLACAHHTSPTSEVITVSMGLAWCEPKSGENCGLLIEAADEALYTSKSNGRNQYSEIVDLASVRSLIPH